MTAADPPAPGPNQPRDHAPGAAPAFAPPGWAPRQLPDQMPDQLPDQLPDQMPDQMPDQGFAQQPAFPPPEDRPAGRRRPEPRMVSLAVGLGVTLAAGAVLFSLPVPYLVETPGPTVDTLGSQDGKELIQIDQEPTHQVTGQLRLTTVGAIGSNPGSLDLFNLVEGYFDGDDAVVPYDLIYPRHTTAEEREAQSAAEMTSSQDAAVAAALEHLGMPVGVEVVEPQTAAAKAVFAAGDELTSINGQPINGFASLKAILGGIEAGGPVEVGLIRDGRAESVTAETSPDGEGGALLGVTVTFKSPVKIEFGVEDIGGPSAGSMFALGIIAKLGPSDLAGGRVIAGTGTVDAEGVIGGIGGIRQKMIGAKRDGAEVFLAPAANCAEVVGNEPPGLQVVKVASLDDAVDALDALRAGSQADLPVCSQADAG